MPKISVLISAYNHQKFVAKTIQSVLDQTFQDFEILITNDNSTDKTLDIIKSFSDPRIKLFENNINLGMVVNTNNMIKMAKGDYIAIINSDDYWELTKLEKQINFFQNNPNYGACFTLVKMVDEENKIIKNPKKNPFKFYDFSKEQFLNYFFFNDNFLCYPSVLIKKNVLEEINFFNPSFIILLDIDAWIRILLKGYEIKILPEILTNFRLMNNEQNLSGRNLKTKAINFVEARRLLNNYCSIKNYQEFIKIFPDYSELSISDKNLECYYYLIDFFYKKYYSKNNYLNKKIKSFLIELIYEKTYENHKFFNTLIDKNILDYKKYSSIIRANLFFEYFKKMQKYKNIIVFLLVLNFVVLLGYLFNK